MVHHSSQLASSPKSAELIYQLLKPIQAIKQLLASSPYIISLTAARSFIHRTAMQKPHLLSNATHESQLTTCFLLGTPYNR